MAGSWRAQASLEQDQYVGVAHRERVHLSAGETAHLGQVVLDLAGELRGRVVDGRGFGLAGAEVTVELLGGRWAGHRHLPLEEARYLGSLLDRSEAAVATVRTDSDGHFEVAGLEPGFVRLWAGAPGHVHAYSDPVAVILGETQQAAVDAADSVWVDYDMLESVADAALWGGVLATVYALMQFLFSPIIGNLADRFS